MSTYTHVGYRPHTGYTHRGQRLAGHTMPDPGQVHALVGEYRRFVGHHYRGLCGVVVHDASQRSDDFAPTHPNVRPAPDGVGTGVTCRRCLRAISSPLSRPKTQCPARGEGEQR